MVNTLTAMTTNGGKEVSAFNAITTNIGRVNFHCYNQ